MSSLNMALLIWCKGKALPIVCVTGFPYGKVMDFSGRC